MIASYRLRWFEAEPTGDGNAQENGAIGDDLSNASNRPEVRIQDDSMNGRKGQKAVVGLRANTLVAAVRLNWMRFGRVRPNRQQDHTTPPQLHVIGRRTVRLTPAAPPSATHPRRSRGPPAGGSGSNPRDWRRAAWGRARADASSRAAPRPAGPRAHGSPR